MTPLDPTQPTPPAPPDPPAPPAPPAPVNADDETTETTAQADLQAQLDAAHAELAKLRAASGAPAEAAPPEDPNDTAGTTKTPPEVNATVEFVHFDAYSGVGGELVHRKASVAAIERDDQGRVLGARVQFLDELPLIPLSMLEY